MKILFIDIDEALSSEKDYDSYVMVNGRPAPVELFVSQKSQMISDICTVGGANIIMITGQDNMTKADAVSLLGVLDIPLCFVDLLYVPHGESRKEATRNFMKGHELWGQIKKYAIVGNEFDSNKGLFRNSKVFQTIKGYGITQTITNAIIEYLED